MSNEKSQNVPVAEAPKQENSNKPTTPVSFPEPPTLQIDLKSINPEMLKTAEALGIPLAAIINYVGDLQAYNQSVETRLRAIFANFDKAVQESVKKMIVEAQQKQQYEMTQQPQTQQRNVPVNSGGLNLNSIAQFLPLLQGLMGGGGNLNDEFQKMMIESFRDRISFAKSFEDTIMQKLAVKAASKVIET